MIKFVKKKAEMVLSANHNIYILSLMFVFVKMIIASAVNIAFGRLSLGAFTDTVTLALISFFIFPLELSFVSMFITRKFNMKQLFEFYSIKKLPQTLFLGVMQTVTSYGSNLLSVFISGRTNPNMLEKVIVCLISLAFILLFILFFASDYFFVKNGGNAVSAVKSSFKLCSNKLGTIILFQLSFFLWFILYFMVYLMLNQFKIPQEFFSVATYSMFGIGIFYYPKLAQSKVFLFDEMTEANQK